MSNLFSSLPTKTYTLREFATCAKSLQSEDDSPAFLRFVLTGEVAGEHQAVLDPIRNVLEENHPIDAVRDYDSVIAITDDIIVSCAISAYPVSNPTEVLTTSVHLTYPITRGDVSAIISIVLFPD
jgi:hypothetical protein